jgi:hypothetical protein
VPHELTNTGRWIFVSGDDPWAVLDQYSDGEELEELILKERNIIDNDLPRTSRVEMPSMIFNYKTLKMMF